MVDFLFDEGKNKIEGLNKTAINEALQSKADAQAVANAFQSVIEALNGKASTQALNKLSETVSGKADASAVENKTENVISNDIVERMFDSISALKPINLIGGLIDGYINYQDGSIHAPTSSKEKTSLLIPVIYGNTYTVESTADKWKRISEYNANQEFIRSVDLQSNYEEKYTPTETVKFVRVSFRSYGNLLDTVFYDNAKGILSNVTYNIPIVEHKGYINSSGGIDAQSSTNLEVYSDLFAITPDIIFELALHYLSSHAMWAAYALYDENKKFIERILFFNNNTKDKEYLLDSLATKYNNGARYISFTYRTFGEGSLICNCNKKDYIIQKSISDNTNDIENIKNSITDVIIGNSSVRSINHRGYNTIAPENTIPAYKLSKQMGFEYVETDVQFTSDNIPVLLHDLTINRTGRNPDGTEISTTIYLRDLTFEQTQYYDFGIWKSNDYAGTKLPKFEDFIKLCRNIGLIPYIEIKSDVSMTQLQVETLVDIVRACGMIKNVIWISFSETLLEYVKNYESEAILGFVVDNITSANITKASSLKTSNNEVFIDCNNSNVNTAGVESCIAAKIPLEVWTVNSDTTILNLNSYISGITSDNKIASRILYLNNI